MASELLRKVLNYSVTDISQHQQDSNGHHSDGLHNGYPGETGENAEEVCSSPSFLFDYYRPQRSCGQGNIFTPVCHSFCSQGGEGVCLNTCWDTTRPDQTPPGADTPLEQTPPGADHPPPGSRLQHTVYERPVRILLECILVLIVFQEFSNSIFHYLEKKCTEYYIRFNA